MNTSHKSVCYSEVDTPIGTLLLAATVQGLCCIEFGTFEQRKHFLSAWAKRWFDIESFESNDKALEYVRLQLQQYFAGERIGFEVELDLQGTAFQKKVWNALLKVPYGEVQSYKDIAVQIGSEKAVRAVGGANNRNPVPIIVPCHRVIGANGALVGYGGGLHMKAFLLELEKKEKNAVHHLI